MSVLDAAVTIVGTGLVSHLCFRYLEPRSMFPLLVLLVIVPALLSAVIYRLACGTFSSIFVAYATYYASLISSTLLYRLSPFHPLASYPGPAIAKTSKLWTAYRNRKGDLHTYLKGLHDHYGDIVRVGPNELSIRDPSLIHPILGHGGLPKGPRWDGRPSPPALIAQRDPVKHMEQRKPWSRALSSSALREYEVILAKRVRQLIVRLDGIVRNSGRKDGAVLDICAWMNYFTTDLMGDMAFGGGFELMADGGDKKGVWALLESNLHILSVLSQVSYAIPIISFFAGRNGPIQRAHAFARDRVIERLKMGAKRKDLFYHLSGEELPESERPSVNTVAQDGTLAIIAGSDTTSSVLTATIYYLLHNSAAYDRLQEEVDAAFPTGEDPLDVAVLKQMVWLNGCIYESLRLQPPLPSGSQRTLAKGQGAKVIGELIIPEETQVFLHTYSIHRDSRNFYKPEAFLPERWLSPSVLDGAHNTAAFTPFSYGPAICAGKNIALLEMRMVLCWLLRHFHFSEAAGVSYQGWEARIQDWFVVHQDPLFVNLSQEMRSRGIVPV
ncbi:high nitrogen upregulated cytochrome P450 monooxygenase 2 [Gloeopeniophorella convolvens]|nr:high nitrogen upregulated cytochrome P450 monooxygenase 2 [Gloeopeniophorella convolvens]